MTKLLSHEQLIDATQTNKGISRFATEQETIDQLLNNVIISPVTLKIALDNRQATEEIMGMAKFASSAEAIAGENATKMISPLTAKNLINSYGLGHTSAKALPDNDLNKAIEIGFYAVNVETLNKPSGFPSFGSVITSNFMNNTRAQILFDTHSGTGVPNGPWIRKTADWESNTINWGSWYKLSNDSHTHNYLPLTGGTITGQLVSTLPIGTSPFSITSTTLNTNLNADLLDGNHSSDDATASTIVKRDASGDINLRLLRPTYVDQATISGAIAFRSNNSTDNYVRFCSDTAAIRAFIGCAAVSHNHTFNSLEMGQVGVANTPFIDFHSGSNNIDYDSRIIAGGGGTVGGGTLTYQAASHVFEGILYPQNNTSYTTGQARRIILSTAAPSGGGNGDIWIKYTA